MVAYALTIFIGAFLLFQVQPLMGKFILPWFGGGPGVWTTCMLFFQVLLLGGYAYAHWSTRWLKTRTQVILHLVLLTAAVAWLLMIPPSDFWKPQGGGNPTLQILVLLAATLGMPYFVLSSTGPLVQQWFSRANPGRSPYRLYALSNAGSLLALLSYPFFFERFFTRKEQAWMWAGGVIVYVICCGFCVLRLRRLEPPASSIEHPVSSNEPPASSIEHRASDPLSTINHQLSTTPATLSRLLWVLLPACASALLLATTNKLCQDVAVIPFLWVLPLALYLLSFIICFDSLRWYQRFPFTLALVAAFTGICWALFAGTDMPIRKQIVIYSTGLFVCCMVCHGELYRLRPDPRFLTHFYLLISAGGALGGMFVAVLAPLLFTDYYELHWSLMLCGLLFLVVCITNAGFPRGREPAELRRCAGEQPEAAACVPEGNMARNVSVTGWRYWLQEFFLLMNDWRVIGCALTLVVFAGFDRFFALMGPGLKPAAERVYPALVGFADRMAEGLDSLVRHFGAREGTVDGLLAARIGMWSILAMVFLTWVLTGRFKRFCYWRWMTCVWLMMGLMALGIALGKQTLNTSGTVLSRSRNFYGVLTVREYNKGDPDNDYYELQNGRIIHGIQFTKPEKAREPTTYYTSESGIGLAFEVLPKESRHIGIIGLGTGSSTVYGRPGDKLRIYEINRAVERLAESRFTYLDLCRQSNAPVTVVLGDARLSMENELKRGEPQAFDLLVLDAFSGDAIPVHLLTKESIELYSQHLKPNGIIAVHISNRYLDLEPVVIKLASVCRYRFATVDYEEPAGDSPYYSSTWVLLCRNQEVLDAAPILDAKAPHDEDTNANVKAGKMRLWTDDFTSLFEIVK